MIVSELSSVYVGLGTAIAFVGSSLYRKSVAPELGEILIVTIAAIGCYSGVSFGIELFSTYKEHVLNPEQVAIIEFGCFAIIHVSLGEIVKSFKKMAVIRK